MSAVIQVKHLSKDFKEVRAVDDLSFTVEAGEVYGFLGQNGAGKSTTIRLLLTLIRPGSGEIDDRMQPKALNTAAPTLPSPPQKSAACP